MLHEEEKEDLNKSLCFFFLLFAGAIVIVRVTRNRLDCGQDIQPQESTVNFDLIKLKMDRDFIVPIRARNSWFIETPRLTLRSFDPMPTEVGPLNPAGVIRDLRAYEQIHGDPNNNVFGARENPHMKGDDLLEHILRECSARKQIKFMIVLKRDNPTAGMDVEGGELIGDIELNAPDSEGKISIIAGCIHWRHAGQGYDKEAFYAVFKHAFKSLYRKQLLLETKAANTGLQAMMRSLKLEPLESPGDRWMKRNPPEASVLYTFDLATWETARREGGLRPLTPPPPLDY
ncbi:hypothetical protein ONS96_005140 [Cadophora gregata f. sp. sojae]|nr:hypothetical protein ONS96_005140 [Cadophora gregata f. sp. sojae]